MTTSTLWRVPDRVAYVVNHCYPFSTNGYAVRTHGVAKGLMAHNHSVIVIARPGYPWDLGGHAEFRKEFSAEIDGVRYLYSEAPARLEGALDQWIAAAADALERLFLVFKPSVVMAASNWENAIPAQRAAARLGLPFVYEARGFWELSRGSREPSYLESADFAFNVAQETAVARTATKVVTLNKFMAAELERRGIGPDKIELLPNGILDDLPRSSTPQPNRFSLGIRSEHVVGYLGSFSAYEGIEDLIEAVASLRANSIDISLLLVGSSAPVGTKESSCPAIAGYKLQAEKLGIADYLFTTGRIEPSDTPAYYDLLDLVVIPRRPFAVSKMVSPIKPFEAASHGKFILMSDVDALREIQSYLPGSECFTAGSVDSLSKALENWTSHKCDYTTQGERNRWAARSFTWASRAAKLSEDLRALVAPSSGRSGTVEIDSVPANLVVPSSDGADSVLLTDTPIWFEVNLNVDSYVQCFGAVNYAAPDGKAKALVLIEFSDKKGKTIEGPYKNFRYSETVGWFSYLYSSRSPSELLCVIDAPPGATRARLGFRSFYAARNSVKLSARIGLKWHLNKPLDTSSDAIAYLPFEQVRPEEPRRLKVASIFDAFSHACFAPECDLIQIRPDTWRQQLINEKIDFILVESAWHGNEDAWLYRIAKYDRAPGRELDDLLRWAKKLDVPTVFWNKEDPPNYDRFIDTAAKFDYIFTTDANCIERYRARVPKTTYVGSLPFAAQPAIHNPYLDERRQNGTSFAGTYYADDFAPRREAMDLLLRAATPYGLDIFDRMHSVTGKDKARFEFPKDLQSYIRGSLSYTEMNKAYRRYRVALNVNSVADSPTMFSRRVFELLACGTPVVSTESAGITRTFGSLVPTVTSAANAAAALKHLMSNSREWQRASVRGLRAVHHSHTYRHRLLQIARTVGVVGAESSNNIPLVVVAVPDGEASHFIALISKQSLKPSEVILIDLKPNDPVLLEYVKRFTEAKIRCRELPMRNIASYIRHRHPGAIVALCDTHHYYGPNYLLDASYAVSKDTCETGSTIIVPDEINHALHSDDFANASAVGTSTEAATSGTIVVHSDNSELQNLINTASAAAPLISFRSRPWFDFLPAQHLKNIPIESVDLS